LPGVAWPPCHAEPATGVDGAQAADHNRRAFYEDTKLPSRSGSEAESGRRPANQRSAARLAAVQALYQMDVGRQPLEETLAQFSAVHLGREIEGETYLPADADYFRQIVTGVIKGQLEIDPAVDGALAEGWPVTRIDATLRAILRAAAYELLRRRDVPPRVVISEYVDIAKAFYEDDTPGLVNGVLDALAKTLPTT
jgi:N utilization substance protein B